MNRGCPEWPFYGQYGALVARVAAIHRLQGREGVRSGSARTTRRAVLAPGPTARKGSAALRRPTPNCRFCAYAVALIGVARFACRKPRNASRPRSRPASTIA